MTNTKVQYQNVTWVQIRHAIRCPLDVALRTTSGPQWRSQEHIFQLLLCDVVAFLRIIVLVRRYEPLRDFLGHLLYWQVKKPSGVVVTPTQKCYQNVYICLCSKHLSSKPKIQQSLFSETRMWNLSCCTVVCSLRLLSPTLPVCSETALQCVTKLILITCINQ